MQKPETLKQLLKIAAKPLWKGLAYERTAHRNVEMFIEIVGDLELSAVKVTTMDTWLEKQTSSPATINRKLANIHSVLKFAHDREWMDRVPKMPWQEEDNTRVRWVSDDEEATMLALLDAWGEVEAKRIITILLDTGLRRGELLTLKPAQVDGQWIRLWKSKTKKARSVPLSPRAVEALGVGLPFSITESQLHQVWLRLREAMGLQDDEDFVLHACRHTAATRTLSKTKNIAVVQKLLGHRKIQTTMRYAHLSDDELLAAVQ